MRKRLSSTLFSSLLLLAALLCINLGLRSYYKAAYPTAYSHLVEEYCEEYGLPPSLVYAVIHTESGFNPMAQSHVGARGLMQLMPDTFDWARLRLGEPSDQGPLFLHQPEVNLKYGVATLALLVEEFGEATALAAYNAGRGSVQRWLKDPRYSKDNATLYHIPFAQTSAYVKKVQRTKEIYRRLYNVK